MLKAANRKNLKAHAKDLLGNEWTKERERELIRVALQVPDHTARWVHFSHPEAEHLEKLDFVLNTYGVEGMVEPSIQYCNDAPPIPDPKLRAGDLPAQSQGPRLGHSNRSDLLPLMPKITAIAGLPGSGKSTLLRRMGGLMIDDFNVAWEHNMIQLRESTAAGYHVTASDIMFCSGEWRKKFERDIGQPVEWVFFANDPGACSRNCTARARRGLMRELEMIRVLSPVYDPPEDALPVHDPIQKLLVQKTT